MALIWLIIRHKDVKNFMYNLRVWYIIPATAIQISLMLNHIDP